MALSAKDCSVSSVRFGVVPSSSIHWKQALACSAVALGAMTSKVPPSRPMLLPLPLSPGTMVPMPKWVMSPL